MSSDVQLAVEPSELKLHLMNYDAIWILRCCALFQ